MARRKEFDDLSVVRAARDVFWEHGYASASLAQLQAATGLSKSSLYETYGSKRGLFARACANYIEEVLGPLAMPVEGDGAGIPELVMCFDGLAAHLRRLSAARRQWGCLMVNTSVQLGDLDAEAVALCAAVQSRLRRGFHHALDGEVADPERVADNLTAGWLGVLVTVQFDPDLAVARAENLVAEFRAAS